MAAVAHYSRPGLPKAEDFDIMTRLLSKIVSNERLLTFYVDDGGNKISQPFEEALRKYGVHSVSYVMVQDRWRNKDDSLTDVERKALQEIALKLGFDQKRYAPIHYRPVLGIKEDRTRADSPVISVSELGRQDAAFALTLDDDNTMGFSAVGNAIGTLIHRDTLGFDKYLQAVYLDDRLGTSHLSCEGLGNPRKQKKLIRRLAPEEYAAMQRKGMIDAIYDSEIFYEGQQKLPMIQRFLKHIDDKRITNSLLAELERHSSWLI